MIVVRMPLTPPPRSETRQRDLSDADHKAEVRLPATSGVGITPMMAASDAVVF